EISAAFGSSFGRFTTSCHQLRDRPAFWNQGRGSFRISGITRTLAGNSPFHLQGHQFNVTASRARHPVSHFSLSGGCTFRGNGSAVCRVGTDLLAITGERCRVCRDLFAVISPALISDGDSCLNELVER